MNRAMTDAFCVTLVVLAAQDAECRSRSMPSPAGNRPSKIYMAVADEFATAQQLRETSPGRRRGHVLRAEEVPSASGIDGNRGI